jgi:hypothetical protein
MGMYRLCAYTEGKGVREIRRPQKGRLIGIESRGIYRILIPETGEILRSRNVRFKEGMGHRTLTTEGDYFANDDEDTDLDFLLPEQDLAPRKPDILPVVDTTPTLQTPQQPKTRQRIVYPPAVHKSARLAGTQLPATVAQLPNSEQMDDASIPAQEDSDEEDDIVTALIANTSQVPEPLNRFIPESFSEGYNISRRHLWFPAISV